MPGRVRMFAYVLIWGAVTAERDTACLARAHVNPVSADLHALGAFANLRLLHGIDRVEMTTTAFRHNYFRLLLEARRR